MKAEITITDDGGSVCTIVLDPCDNLIFDNELRDLPIEDGWRRQELTGQTTVTLTGQRKKS